ncbi:hypothetical protein N8I77_012908 [Diaporthe amygdali]|uniref:FAD dependent oxidoreductase domain-containing protein n=1 Tax=Phomopsis amygdali TaxID=1214568 RepID=A0AAD9VWX2_PHOAM|nr:hypothetical protein N8I77_012908 [Diaporthe amygdali]
MIPRKFTRSRTVGLLPPGLTVLEATKIAGGSSGKGAGCLGEWADPACLAPASFELHAQLAKEHDGEKAWGYRKCDSADCDTVERHMDDPDADTRVPETLDWVDRAVFKWYKPLGKTAQCHPYLFTTSLARLAEERGVRFVEGSAEAIVYSNTRDEVQSVTYRDKKSGREQQLPATNVVLAAGPWTQRLLPEAPIGGERSHSIVIDPGRDVSPTIIFFDAGHIFPGDTKNQLEVYPRPDKTVYMCGQTDYGANLPATTDEVEVNPNLCQELVENIAIVSPDLAKSQVLIRQACFRPIVNLEGRDPELGPLLGFTGIKGLVLAAGHNQWGINNSPITGKIISDLVFDGQAMSANISELDPQDCLIFK